MYHLAAIVTRYIGPTNNKGGRIAATCKAGRLVFDYNHALGVVANHAAAAEALRAKLDWTGVMTGGTLPNGDTCWTLAPAVPFSELLAMRPAELFARMQDAQTDLWDASNALESITDTEHSTTQDFMECSLEDLIGPHCPVCGTGTEGGSNCAGCIDRA